MYYHIKYNKIDETVIDYFVELEKKETTKPSKALWVLNIVATVFISLDLIWACVLVAISENDLSTKEKGKLYGNMIVLYLALISLQLHRQFKIKKVIK